MTTNTKIRTEDVHEILDFKIKTSASHSQIDVVSGEFYDSVLAKIAARSPTLDEKDALENAVSPSASNPFVTVSELTASLAGSIPWKTIGPIGSGADFEGSDEQPFLDAFATMPDYIWFYVKPGVYNFTNSLTVPNGIRLIGSVTAETILSSSTDTLILGQDSFLGFMTVISTSLTETAIVASSSSNIEIRNCILASTSTGKTLDVTNATYITMADCALLLGNMVGSALTHASLSNLYVDVTGGYGIQLVNPEDVIIWGSIFYAGMPEIESGTNVRVVGNHFNNGISNITPISSVLFRANTPSSNNNEDESLTALLQYLGSPSALQTTPSYSSNFAGPQAQDITARASAIDLLLQWIYEERNFSLVAETEPMVVTWNPATMILSTSGIMHLISAHRDAVWKLPIIASANIPSGNFLYYILDRSLNTTDITLTPQIAPLGSIPIDTNPPTGSASNRQIWILAYNLNGTLWWRGGGGSRFPATNGSVGEYFVDGTSKSLLTYLGSSDYNDYDPNYSNNFTGVQGESLTTRIGKTDTLIKRLFEHSNLSYYFSSDGYFSSDATGSLILNGTLTFRLPHIAGDIIVNSNAWSIPDGSLLYFTWDQVSLGVAASTVATNVALPDSYPLTTKYFVAAIRVGSTFYMWDGTRLPMSGGRWPLLCPSRSVILTAEASTLIDSYGIAPNNCVWVDISGTRHLLWENLAVLTSTGISLNRNTLANQTSPSLGLTNLSDGEGLVITHTWNSGSAQNVLIEKVSLPLSFILEQNQFLWVQNRNGYLLFTGEF